MDWKTYTWEELSRDDLYDVLRLRAEVFVVEQDCVYQDLDGKDQKAIHIVAWDKGSAVATARVLPPGVSYNEPSIGRVVVASHDRAKGLGRELMGRSLAACFDNWPEMGVRISAQCYLEPFYWSMGFEVSSVPYEEDGLPHVQMFRDALPPGAWTPFAHLKHSLSEWQSAVSKMPDELIFGSRQGGWLAGAITSHLLAAEVSTWKFLANQVKQPVETLSRIDEISTSRALGLSSRLRSTERYAMPDGLPEPDPMEGPHAFERSMAIWLEAQNRGRALIARLPIAYWGVHVFQHPLAGAMGLTMTGCFLADHVTHHHHQLRRLLGEE